MAKKKTTEAPAEGVKEKIESFRSRVEGYVTRGYTCLGTSVADVKEVELSGKDSMRTAMAKETSEFPGGKNAHHTFSMFDGKQSNPVPVDGAGTDGFGYIPWGPKNDLPNKIYNLGASLPYTAAALRFLTDLTAGHGPVLMYKWPRYAGGTLTEELVPFEHAGVLIQNRLRELRNKLKEEEAQKQETQDGEEESSSSPASGSIIHWNQALQLGEEPMGESPVPPKEEEVEPEIGSLEYEIKELEADYKEWKRSWEEIDEFIKNNNLTLHFLKCTMDYVHMDMYFPTVGFNVGNSGKWDAKIKYVGHIPVVCARMEQMDSNLRSNYVYYSEKWRQDATAELQGRAVVAYPAVMNETMVNGWKKIVDSNQRTRVKDRPTTVACPIRYPSMQNPYYSRPAWWSIFPSMVYQYASTLVVDKAIARQNSTMWSKIIFIDQQYLEQVFLLMNAETPEEQQKVRNDIYNRVNRLLQQKENNGKTLLMDKYLGPDGKTVQYSIDIVDVPQPSSGAETKDELEEISSIIFFAFGVHPALIGAVPGKSGSSGGTYQRELTLIKQNLLAPTRSLYLKFLQNIHTFNKWDKHGVWKISDLVLTTLDRSKTGTEETVN